ncbi:hypothetical protein A9G08_00675 [Gilliamella sp. wkB195]|uniref:hypothetical protein n=1 Tax=Gilliamella sp. wkB195 TaxID=3120261 RepID=UPI00080E1882|nr:hypothetical protein [Gilliamella apicola]OCF95383.1 hypothetical protein A9G08_00675 [Gilliamella apicola]
MFYNFQQATGNRPTWSTSNLNSPNSNSQPLFFHSSLLVDENLRSHSRSLWRSSFGSSRRSSLGSKLLRQIFLPLVLLLIPFYSSHALTAKTSNMIRGNAPYLTFDGGKTRVLNIEALLGITLSNGKQYTTTTNTSSSSNPIELPVAGQSFADIDMIVPTNVDLITLKTLIGPPNNYWGDDDGDDEIKVNGFLELSLVDYRNRTVSRNTVLRPCNAPYEVILTNTNGTLTTRYGIPNSSDFNPSRVTYFVKPKGQEICFATPSLSFEGNGGVKAGPPEIFDPSLGFLPQSTDSYGKNFPTTGANNMYFDLSIAGNKQALSWSPVSRGGITATMSNSTATGVRVTLTGPVATESQWNSSNPGPITKPTLPQTFELVGRDSSGKAIVKYGFTLKQWFVNRGKTYYSYPSMESWCNSIGYRLPKVKDLTNAKRYEITGGTPSSSGDYYMRTIGASLLAEWGNIGKYDRTNFDAVQWYWTSDVKGLSRFVVFPKDGHVHWAEPSYDKSVGLCTLP